MPTYAYACSSCQHTFDAVQSFTDAPLESCPQCQGKLRKLFNSIGVVFKGSGFYRNDSRPQEKSPQTEGAGSTGNSEKSSGDSSSKSSGKSSESSPAKTPSPSGSSSAE